MAGALTNNYGIGDTNFDNMMLTIDAQRVGYHQVTLTEFDTSTIPQIAAGSKIEVGGSLFEFDSNESPGGSPSNGTVYIYLSETKGTASGATTDATGYSIGTTTITLASAGTGTIIAGDRVTFAGDTVKYVVTSGDADVSNGGTITIASPGLLTAIPASATAITVYAGAIEATFTNTAPVWSDAKQGWYDAGSANRYLNFKMEKTGSNYANKGFLLLDKTMDFLVKGNGDVSCNALDINAMASQSIVEDGYIVFGSLYIQWGLETSVPASGTKAVTFPISFPTNAHNVVVSATSPGGAGSLAGGIYSTSVSTSGFTVNNNTGVSVNCYWQAIGN